MGGREEAGFQCSRGGRTVSGSFHCSIVPTLLTHQRFLSWWKSTKHLQVSGPLASLTIQDVSIYKTGIQQVQPPSISNGHAGHNGGEEHYFICCSS